MKSQRLYSRCASNRKSSRRWRLLQAFTWSGTLLLIGATIILLAEKPGHLVAAAQSKSPSGMVLIPAGDFAMGTDDPNSMHNERPAHQVHVGAFWMDEHDVTNAEFRAFVQATGYVTTAERPIDWEQMKKQVPAGTPKPPDEMLKPGSLVFAPPDHPVDLRDMSAWWTWTNGASWKHPQGPKSNIDGKDEYPVVQVCWDDAVAYAKWAGKRLPTEAEWEYAARGGAKTNTRYWWGDEFRPGGKFMCNTFTGEFPYHNTVEDGYAGISPVHAFPPNGYGLYDMAGNVWQWTSDLYRADVHVQAVKQHLPQQLNANKFQLNLQFQADKQPTCCPVATECFDPTNVMPNAVERVTKGGSFLCNPNYCESYRPTARRGTPPDTGTEHIGFRCVMDVALKR